MSRRLVALLALAICLAAVCAVPSSAWALAFSGQPPKVGGNPYCVAVADFNGDGKPDMVTANAAFSTVSVLLGDGAGGFAAKTDFATGSGPRSVAVSDFNGDGKLDLVTTNDASTVSVLLGNGAGGFAAKTDFATGTSPWSVAVGDVNGDGSLDLVTANRDYSGTMSVLLGHGDGSFAAKTDFATGRYPVSVAEGDFNRDGKKDLAVMNNGSGTVSVFLGDGAGGFTDAVDLTAGINPDSVAVGDFNRDGKLDIVTADQYSSGTVSVFLGHGDGTFAARAGFATGTEPSSVAVGDVNGDGKLDLVTSDSDYHGSVSVLLGNGAGSFAANTDFPVGSVPASVALADLNGDGKLDLATANFNAATASVLLGNGAGGFVAPSEFATGAGPGWSVAVRRLQRRRQARPGDGEHRRQHGQRPCWARVMAASSPRPTTPTGANPYVVAVGDLQRRWQARPGDGQQHSATISVLLGNGDGGFAAKTDFATGTAPCLVALGDFNGDGTLDVATANWGDSTISVLLGNGSGGFAAKTDFATGSHPFGVAVGDFNGDGRLDVATANRGLNTVSVLLGNGDGGFAAKSDFVTGANPYAIAVGDLNSDGNLDVATANFNDNTVSVLLGNGDGGFAAKTDFATDSNPISVALGDVNTDGKLDLVTSNTNSYTVSVLLGTGTGSFGAKTDLLTGANPYGVAVGDVNNDGRLDLVTANYNANTVSVLLNQGPGPVGTMLLLGGADATNSRLAEIDSTVSGATQMRFRDSGASWDSWQAYSDRALWTLPAGDGSKTVQAQYRNASGQLLDLADSITLDTTAPVTSDDAPADWQASGLTVTLTPSDPGGSGVASTQYRVDGATSWSSGTTVAVSGDGIHSISYRSTDNAGNVEKVQTIGVKIDAMAPVTTDNASPGGVATWHPGPWTLQLTPIDPLGADGSHSGMSGGAATTQYSTDGGTTWVTGTSVPFAAWKRGGGSGSYGVLYRSTDAAGNLEATESATVLIDSSAPTSSDDAASTPQTGPVTVHLLGTDAFSGVATIWYSLDGSTWVSAPYPGGAGLPVTIAGADSHTLRYYAIDAAGNVQVGYRVCQVTISGGGSSGVRALHAPLRNSARRVHRRD